MKIIDFHIHTHFSCDCNMNIPKIIETAKKKGLTGGAICDHNTIKGGLEAFDINKDKNFEIIVGAEICTNAGDVSGLFLKEEIHSKNYSEVIQEIKNQNGLVLLNHPYKHDGFNAINYDGIDFIEGYNSRMDDARNDLAVRFAKKINKPVVGGSDAHVYSEIANCKTYYASSNILKPTQVEYQHNRFYCELISQWIKVKKQKELGHLIRLLRWAPKHIATRLMHAHAYSSKRSITL